MTTVKLNLRNNAPTQYGGFPFTDFCVFNGRPIGAGPDGIFTLDGYDKDVYTETTDERDISGWFELPISQFAINHIKRGRRLYIGGEFNGQMSITVETTGGSVMTNTYNITPRNLNNVQHTIQVPLNSRQRSEYWRLTVSNILGADFSIDFIDGVFIPVVRRLGL